ncbi:hypothetical protein [Sphingobacterium kyonggiense]
MNWLNRNLLAFLFLLVLSCNTKEGDLLPEIDPGLDLTEPIALNEEFLLDPVKMKINNMANGNYRGLAHGRFFIDISGPESAYCHPDIQYFPNGFRGYKYWMVFTPYFGKVGTDFYAKRYENPTVVVSNDAINWIEPVGIHNPIQLTPSFKESFLEKKGELVQGFWSDVDWLYRNGQFELYYRGSCISADALKRRGAKTANNRSKLKENAQRTIVRQTSTDGINWSPLEVAFTSNPPHSPKNSHVISPSFVEVNKDIFSYEVTFNNNKDRIKSDAHTLVVQRKSQNGLDFSNFTSSKVINFLNKPWLELDTDNAVWHLNANYDQGYYFLVLSVGNVKKYTSDLLYLAYSKDGINFIVDPKPVISYLAYRSAIFLKQTDSKFMDFGMVIGTKDGNFNYAEIRVDKDRIKDAFN